jgi:ubiquitin thioesterase protein OTUB1
MEHSSESLGEYLKTNNNTDQLTIEQVETIRSDIAAVQPLIGKLESVECLLEKYQDSTSPGFIPGIKYLSTAFQAMRQVRGDGNCFYRAMLFGYLENLLKLRQSNGNEERAQTELNRFTEIIKNSLQNLVNLGYPEFALEGFHEVFFSQFCFFNVI